MQEIVTVEEAARFLNKHPSTIRRWILTKKLRARKIAGGGTGVFVILKTDLLEFAVAKMVKAERKAKNENKKVSLPSEQESFPI